MLLMDGAFMSRKCASIFAQSAKKKNMSGSSSTRRESCKIGLRAAGAATGPDGSVFPSGKSLPERGGRAKAAASSKGPRLGQREEILLHAQNHLTPSEDSPEPMKAK